MFQKNLLTGIIILTLCSTSYQTSLSNQYFNYFDTGYTIGVLPLTWKYIPYGLKSVSQNKIATCFGIVGFIAATSVYGLAIYGLKTLITKDKKIESKKPNTNKTSLKSVETQTEPGLKRTNSSYRGSKA